MSEPASHSVTPKNNSSSTPVLPPCSVPYRKDVRHTVGDHSVIENATERGVFLRLRYPIMQASQKRGDAEPFASERACAELPAGHPLVWLVSDEHVFRMADRDMAASSG